MEEAKKKKDMYGPVSLLMRLRIYGSAAIIFWQCSILPAPDKIFALKMFCKKIDPLTQLCPILIIRDLLSSL